MAHILIIEDDFAIATALRQGLHRAYLVDTVRNGAQVVHKAELADGG